MVQTLPIWNNSQCINMVLCCVYKNWKEKTNPRKKCHWFSPCMGLKEIQITKHFMKFTLTRSPELVLKARNGCYVCFKWNHSHNFSYVNGNPCSFLNLCRPMLKMFYFHIIALSLMSILAFFGNISVIIHVMMKSTQQQTLTNKLIGNIAVADLLSILCTLFKLVLNLYTGNRFSIFVILFKTLFGKML